MSKRIGWAAALAVAVALGVVPAAPGGGKKLQSDEIRLFNGRNLDGWDTWLGKPHNGSKALGLNSDPKKVFSVVSVDGQPALRVSGEILGALTTQGEYENYSVRLEFKWGQKQWPPRGDGFRESGLLYHAGGRHGAEEGAWMRALECDLKEEHCGSFRSVAGALAEVRAVPMSPKNPLSPIVFDPRGKNYQVPRHIEYDEVVKDDPLVLPRNTGSEFSNNWNTVEVRTVGTTSVHYVNGKAVMALTDTRYRSNGQEVPLKRGRIQLQSAGSEVFFRNIVLRPITSLR